MTGRTRDGQTLQTYDGEGKIIGYLYGTALGKGVLSVMVRPWFSKLGGFFLSTGLSRMLIRPFIRKNHLDLSDYPEKKYSCFNDFFSRSIDPAARPIDPDPCRVISPADGKLTLLHAASDQVFRIKGADYTLLSLLQDPDMAVKFTGGTGLLIRLTVDDLHRYAYPVSGKKGGNIRINGVYHTVNPIAAEHKAIYRENTREYTVFETEQFGSVLMMEVGALLVGRIRNLKGPGPVVRGEEKGYFEFGGSSVVLFFEKDRFIPDEDIVRNSAEGIETIVKLGMGIGSAVKQSY